MRALALAAAAAGMVEVPAGTAVIGADDGDADERPARTVTVAAFAIDRTEVTAADYARCVAAGACRPADPAAREGAVDPSLPAVGVSWHDAVACCRFAGKRLPTEAEWEKAARGAGGRRYPWGDHADCAAANFGNFAGSGPCPDNPGRIEPVGRRPAGASPGGALDLGGNAWEWVDGPARPGADARLRVLKGGGCCGYFSFPRAAERLLLPANYRDRDIGFRCAR